MIMFSQATCRLFLMTMIVGLPVGALSIDPAQAGLGFDCEKGKAPNKKGKCVPCGHKDQPACEPMRKGPQCFDYLGKVDGICRANMGGEGQPTFKGLGFDCRPGFNKDPNDKKKCTACGHEDQPACEPMRKGPQCFDYLGKVDGICKANMGGEGQPTFKGLGFDCRPGFNKDPDNKKQCTACGELNQVACEIMRKGARCKTGLKAKNGMCVPDPESVLIKKVKDESIQKLKDYLADIVDMIVRTQNAENDSLQKTELRVAERNIHNASVSKASATKGGGTDGRTTFSNEQVPDNNACEFGNFQSWSLGFGADANVVKGGGGEAGFVFRCADHQQGQKDAKLYWSTNLSKQVGAGASAGATVGMWKEPFDAIAGKAHGFTMSITSLAETVKMATVSTALLDNLKDLGAVSPDVAISVWFERKNNDEVGDFQGISVSISGGVGLDLGGTYSQETTYQF